MSTDMSGTCSPNLSAVEKISLENSIKRTDAELRIKKPPGTDMSDLQPATMKRVRELQSGRKEALEKLGQKF